MKVSIVSNGFEWIISINGVEVCRGTPRVEALDKFSTLMDESIAVLSTHGMDYDKYKGMEYDTFNGKLSFIEQGE
jgi:hypothetical protein